MSYLPTGAFVCPRSHNLGIAFWGFIVPLHPSNHARDHVLGFYSSTPVTQPISEPGQTKEPGCIFIYIYHQNHTKCGYHIPIPWILRECTGVNVDPRGLRHRRASCRYKLGEAAACGTASGVDAAWRNSMRKQGGSKKMTLPENNWVVVSKIFFVFIPIWGRFPLWLIWFKGVETTN